MNVSEFKVLKVLHSLGFSIRKPGKAEQTSSVGEIGSSQEALCLPQENERNPRREQASFLSG